MKKRMFNVLTAGNNALQPSNNPDLLVSDSQAPELQDLLRDAVIDRVVIAPAEAPLEALTRALASRSVGTLHIVAHGRPGGFALGNQWIDAELLRQAAALLASWQVERIALWTCHGGADVRLAEEFARWTGAEVYAAPAALGWVDGSARWALERLSPADRFHDLAPMPVLPVPAAQALSWQHQLASYKFVSAYAVNTATTPAAKEQNSVDFSTTNLGSAVATDGSNGVNFSGNDVVVKLTINGADHYGWISRPIKSGGVVKGFYFWKDSSFTDLSTATTDGNRDTDGNAADNSGFVLVVDQAFFDGLSVSGGLKTVGSSSDRVDSTLNAILPVNSAPVATNDSVTFLEDSSAQTGNVLTNDSDSNGDSLSVTGFSINGSSGSLGSAFSISGVGSFTLNASGSFTFTPVANYAGAVPVITYTVSDGSLSSTGKLAIMLTGVNDAPAGADKTISSQENQAYTFSTADFGFTDAGDTPANALQAVVITTLPGAGTLTLNGASVSAGQSVSASDISKLRFTPATNGAGDGYALFTFQVRDDGGTANSGVNLDASANTITFNVSNVNTAPTAVADTASATEAGGASNATAGTNPAGNVITNDTDVDSGDSKSVVTAGSAATSATSVATNTSVVGVYGTLVISSDGSYTYTVNNSSAAVQALRTSSQTLTDTFSYTIADAAGLRSSSSLTLTIQGANDTPDAVNDAGNAKESIHATVSEQYTSADSTGYKATGNVLGNDTDVDSSANGETRTVAGLSGSANANVVGSANASTKLTFTAQSTLSPVAEGFEIYVLKSGVYRALYTASGTQINVATKTDLGGGTYEFTLNGTPATYYDAGGNISIASLSGESVGFENSTNTTENEAGMKLATVSSSAATGNSTATLTSVSGTLAAGMSVSGTGVPSGTTIQSIAYDGFGNPTLTFSAIISSTTGIVFSFSANAGTTLTGRYGTLVLASDGAYTYTPTANNAGLTEGQTATENFTYRLTDASNAEDTAVLAITVTGSGTNDPDANADTATAVEAGTAGGTDPSGNVITAATGAGSVADTTPGGTGTLSVVAAAASGSAETSVATNTAIAGSFGTLTISSSGDYSYAVNNSNATVNALRTSSNTLTEVFSYRVRNSVASKEAVTTLTITIQGGNDAPVAVADTASAYEAGGYANGTAGSNPGGNVLSNDTDVDTGDARTVSAFSTSGGSNGTVGGSALSGSYGTLTLAANGSYTYAVTEGNATVQALASGQSVSEVFNYTVQDSAGATSSSTLTVTVNGANDAPVNTVPGTSPSVAEGGTVAISGLSVADVDSSSLTTTLTVLNGTLSIGTPGSAGISGNGTASVTLTGTPAAIAAALGTASYTGAANFSGTDTLTLVSTDGGSLRDTDTLDITVNPDNRALTVSGTTVNEASPFALFQVSGVAGQKLSLALGSTASTTDVDASSGTDYLANLQYFDGSSWVDYSGGLVTIPAGGSTLLVRVPVLNDSSDESDETFQLTATNKAGTASTGTATLVDDGNGAVYLSGNNTFTANTGSDSGYPATLDDDRALSVGNISVNENSSHAVFKITGSANQVITLAQVAGSAASGTDYGSTLQVWDGSAWNNYSSSATLSAGGVLFVRSTISDDTTYEGPETFGLRATNGGGVGYTGTATIFDDGTGLVYDGTVTGSSATTSASGLDNDLSVSVTAATPVSENSSYAMFAVTATAGSALTLALAGSGTTQATTSGFTTEFSTDGGSTWTTYSASATPVAPGTLGSGTGVIHVRVNIASEADTTYEVSETFSLTATMAAGGSSPLNASAELAIVDNGTGARYDGTVSGGNAVSVSTGLDNDKPTLSVSSVTVSEASPFAVFTASLSNASSAAVSFTPSLANGTATIGTDTGNTPSGAAIEYYNGSAWVSAASGVTIAAGSTSVLLRAAITNDTVFETSETFTLSTGTITGAVTNSGAASGTVTIKDDGSSTNVFLVGNTTATPTSGTADDDTPTGGLTLSTSTLATSETGTTGSFTVKLNSQPTADVTVTLTGLDSSEGSLSTTTLTFTSGNWNTAQTVTVTGADDTLDDGDIAYTLTATTSSTDGNYTGANARTGTVTVTNADNDAAPTLSIGDASAGEGTGSMTFTVTRSGATGGTTTVDYATADGTATAGSDYTAKSGSLSFAPGETSKTITVAITDDAITEGNETLTVGLSNIADATSSAESITDASGSGTITDNDSAGLTISSGTLATSETGTSGSFTVKLNSQPTADVTVTLTGLDSSEGSLSTTTLTFTSSNWATAQTVTVTGADDTLDDGDIAYTLTATSASSDGNYGGSNVRTGTVTVTNTDDDVAPTLAIAATSAAEGSGNVTFTVTRSGATGGTTTVDYATADGSAAAGSDYTAKSGTLSFAPGETSKTISIAVRDDRLDEDDETFSVTLSNVSDTSGASPSFSTSSASATITDDDSAGLQVGAAATLETNESGTSASFTLVLNSQPAADVTVTLAGLDTTEGSLSATTLTFTSSNWDSSQTITVTGLDDTLVDGTVGYTLTATASSSDQRYNGINGSSSVKVNNADNDTSTTLDISPASASEAAGVASFVITRSGVTSGTTTVDYRTVDGSARAGEDYQATQGVLRFAPGETSKTITVALSDDAIVENAETFSLTLGNAADTLAKTINFVTASAAGTITDNDFAGLLLGATALVTSESGTSGSFTARLTSQPASNVILTFSGLDASEGSLDTTAFTFTAQDWNVAQIVTVTGLDDNFDDGDISYTLQASTSSSDGNYNGLAASSGKVAVTNLDDDTAPMLAIDSVVILEDAGIARFTVTRSGASAGTTTVDFATSDGTAKAGSDYTSQSGSLTFAAGETSKTIDVVILDDGVMELGEQFSVSLTRVADSLSPAASIATATGTANISDDDVQRISSIDASSATEGELLNFAVALSTPASTPQVYAFKLGGTADALDYGMPVFSNGVVYDSVTGLLTIPAGVTSFSVSLPTVDDARVEAAIESVTLTIGDSVSTGSLLDNDKRPDPLLVTDVTETPTDPTPFDLLTGDVTQVIKVSGKPAHTIRLYTAEGTLVPTDGYTFTETSPGFYQIDATALLLAAGDYVARQVDADGNESLDSNRFTIDSTPELQDNTNARALRPDGGMNGRLAVIDQNRVDLTDLQFTRPPANWYDSDGESVVFGIANLAPTGRSISQTLDSGSSLTLDIIDGSYEYRPADGATVDNFLVTVRDPGGKGGNLTLTFEVRDLLDRDGVPGNTEDALAATLNGSKDRNNDGIDDSLQNSVSTLAWIRKENFSAAVTGQFDAVPGKSIITIVSHESMDGTEPSPIAQLIGIEVLALGRNDSGGLPTTGLEGFGTPWDPIKFTIEPLQSLGLIDINAELPGLQTRVTIDISAAAIAVGTFTGYMKYISADTIAAANAAGVVLTNFDGMLLTDSGQAGWYDFMQRAPGGDGARFIEENGLITGIELILTDNAFGDVDFTVGRITDPGMPVAAPDLTPPVIVEQNLGVMPQQKFVAENSTAVAAFDASEPASWSLAASIDAALFALDTNGTLSFIAAPDYEKPRDSNRDNDYELIVQATDLAGNTSSRNLVVTVTDVLEAMPVFAAAVGKADHYLSGILGEAQAKAGSDDVRIEFYALPEQEAGSVALKAWINTITGDYFYAPEGTPPPYACYIPVYSGNLGYVLKPGQGAFDVRLYMNAQGTTQIMGEAVAAELGLKASGYKDLGVLFASPVALDATVTLIADSGLQPAAYWNW